MGHPGKHLPIRSVIRMLSFPWILRAVGVVLILLGYFAGAIRRGRQPSSKILDHRLSDREIAARLQEQSAPGASGILVFLGILCFAVSLVWRLIARFF